MTHLNVCIWNKKFNVFRTRLVSTNQQPWTKFISYWKVIIDLIHLQYLNCYVYWYDLIPYFRFNCIVENNKFYTRSTLMKYSTNYIYSNEIDVEWWNGEPGVGIQEDRKFLSEKVADFCE